MLLHGLERCPGASPKSAVACWSASRAGTADAEGLLPRRLAALGLLEPAPVAVGIVELDDRSRASFAGRRQRQALGLGDDRRRMPSWVSSGGTTVAPMARPSAMPCDVQLERTGVAEIDPVVDEIPVRTEVLGESADAVRRRRTRRTRTAPRRPTALDRAARRVGVVEETSSRSSHCSSNARRLASSSSTANPGGSPASIGNCRTGCGGRRSATYRSARGRDGRAPTALGPVGSTPNSRRVRWRNSAAAFSVKVMAAMPP